ncbi:DUF2147 domain-containing protein [Thiotrichales bacterium 19S9-12]|nr:DUF2147 domain-containing protein [Thiotrichales bacterium 19S9-11]MCF6812461.1 DUF2147 domain-containing protein [Thiotrichales bacterium 19S9-12]
MRVSVKLMTATIAIGLAQGFSSVYADVSDQARATQRFQQKVDKERHQNKVDIMSPVGYWIQYSDANHRAQSVFQIYMDEKSNKLEGKLLVPFFRVKNDNIAPPNINCEDCGKGEDNGYSYDYTKEPYSRVQGMKLLWGFTKAEDEDNKGKGIEWDNGSLLDPESGHVYSGYLYTQDWGRELYLRGYWGISLIGRTQVWKRITKEEANYWVKTCGLVNDGSHYPYTNKVGHITNEKLWSKCSNIKL